MVTNKLVALVNRKNYPITIKYGDTSFQLAPKSTTKKEFIEANLKVDLKDVTIIR